MRYLVQFAQRHVPFRLPEFDALLKMEGLEPKDVYDPCGEYDVRRELLLLLLLLLRPIPSA